MANAMVIGIGGVGSVIGQKLHEFDCFDRIVLADMDTVFAKHLASRTPRSRFVVVQANAMDTDRLTALMREHSVSVTCNACTCQTNHSVLEACLRAGSHYLDMAADIYSPPGVKRPGKNSFEAEIEKFNQAYLDRNLAGVLCMGMDPGAVNVLCALGHGPSRHGVEHPRARRGQCRGARISLRGAVLAGDVLRGARRESLLREGTGAW